MKKFWITLLVVAITVTGFISISGYWLFRESPWRLLGFLIFVPTLLLPAVWWWESYFNRVFNKDK